MKYLIAAICFLMASFSALAEEPSTQSIEKLLAVTEAEKLVTSAQQQMDGILAASMAQALKGEELTPRARQIADRFQQKSTDIFRQELSWENMKGVYIQVYKESFTQEEINEAIKFYESPTGKMFVAKMPVVMQKTMGLMEQRIGPLMQKMQAAMEETIQEINAAQKDKKAAKKK